MTREFTFTVTEPGRLDAVLASELSRAAEDPQSAWAASAGTSRSQVAKWIEKGRVLINGRVASKPGDRVKAGAIVSITIAERPPLSLTPDPNIPLDIVFEDSEILVLNKPAGLVVHPGAGQREKTLLHGILAHVGTALHGVGGTDRPGLVHRLDKDTTGLLVVAKTARSYEKLIAQFADRTISRTYFALTLNRPKTGHTIDLPLGRDPRDRKKFSVQKKTGREARTVWEIEEVLTHGVLLRVKLETGRTHQIRVHMKAVGAPIVGDPTYGPPQISIPPALRPACREFGRQALHAGSLAFRHPKSDARVEFEAKIPADMQRLLEVFR